MTTWREIPPVFVFEDDGRIAVDGFCNDFYGTYRLSRDVLEFHLVSTAALCSVPPGVMEAEELLWQALIRQGIVVARGEVSGTLELRAGTTTLHLTRTDRRPPWWSRGLR